MTTVTNKPKAIIMARVFRAKQVKPLLLPERFWRFAQAKRWPGTGRWENHGVIASSDKGTAHIN